MSDAQSLLDLQAADLEIVRAEKRLEDLPEKAAILDARHKAKEATHLREKAAMLVRKLEAEVKSRQDEVALLQAKIASEQTKIMGTTDHRAVQSMTREMDGLNRRVDKLEMEELGFIERADKARSQVAAIDEHLGKLAALEEQLVGRYKKAGGKIQSEIKTAKVRRSALASRLPADLLASYESVRESHAGIGVGRLDGTMCSACRMNLPAERVKELTCGPQIGTCPQCRRIIVIIEEQS